MAVWRVCSFPVSQCRTACLGVGNGVVQTRLSQGSGAERWCLKHGDVMGGQRVSFGRVGCDDGDVEWVRQKGR
jgi:hypothetical protein